MKVKKLTPITEFDIRRALKYFLSKGGFIKKLPDEVGPKNVVVGSEYGMFENLTENYLL